MAMNLYNTNPGDGLFNMLGGLYGILNKIVGAYGDSVPNAFATYFNRLELLSDPSSIVDTISALPRALTNWRSGATYLIAPVRTAGEKLLLELVKRDAPHASGSVDAAIAHVIAEMLNQGYYVAPNVVAITITAAATNAGPQPSIVYISTDTQGNPLPVAVPETLDVQLNDSTYVTISTGASVDWLDVNWPEGSGVSQTVDILDDSDSLVPSAGIEDISGELPIDWILTTGTEGTHVIVTDPEVQTVTISGTPTGGWYMLLYTDPDDTVWSTAPLAYNADGTQVQEALRKIPDLAKVTVSTTGTAPNYTHTITFTGLGGEIAQLTSINGLTGGSNPTITHATTTPADPHSWRGRTLKLISDGTTATCLYAPITVESGKHYVLHLRAKRVGTATKGVLELAITKGIGGAITIDDYGHENKTQASIPAISGTTHQAIWCPIHFKAADAGKLYLRITLSTPPDDGVALYLDDVMLVAVNALYTGGPAVAAFCAARTPRPGQRWKIAVTNTRAGKLLEWTARVFRLATLGRALPTQGTTQIPDSVIPS